MDKAIRSIPTAIAAAVAIAFCAPLAAQPSTAQGGSGHLQSPGTFMQPGEAIEEHSGVDVRRGAADNTNSAVAPASPDATNLNRIEVDRPLWNWSYWNRAPAETQRRQERAAPDAGMGNTVPPRTGQEVPSGDMGPGNVRAQ